MAFLFKTKRRHGLANTRLLRRLLEVSIASRTLLVSAHYHAGVKPVFLPSAEHIYNLDTYRSRGNRLTMTHWPDIGSCCRLVGGEIFNDIKRKTNGD